MAIVKVIRSEIRCGDLVCHNGIVYTASANSAGYLYMWRATSSSRDKHRQCVRTDAKMIEVVHSQHVDNRQRYNRMNVVNRLTR